MLYMHGIKDMYRLFLLQDITMRRFFRLCLRIARQISGIKRFPQTGYTRKGSTPLWRKPLNEWAAGLLYKTFHFAQSEYICSAFLSA